MGRPEKPLDVSAGVAAEFANDLRRLRVQAGSPTYREMSRSALFSSSVLSSAASGTRLPSLPVALAFVDACGGDPETWRRRWLRAFVDERPDTAARRSVQQGPRPASGWDGWGKALPRPAQLPLRPRGFVGRTEELRRLGSSSPTPVVISGPVGVGKSEFALRYAHDLAPDMVDGQLYADLGPSASSGSDARAVLDGFLQVLGIPAEHLPGAVDLRAGLYRSLLAERRLLVLLDNVHDERQVRPFLAETRHSLTIMVSRAPLLGLRDIRRVRLDVLPRPNSIAMIAAAVPDRAAADPGQCDRLAELCGDLPLALDIAVRKLVARPDIPLRAATGRLGEPGVVLDWLRIGDLSVWESLDSAYRQLGPPAKALLSRFAWLSVDEPIVPAGGRHLGAMVPGPAEDELFEELAEAGMLRRGRGRGGYRLDSLVRAFVRDLASHSAAVPAG